MHVVEEVRKRNAGSRRNSGKSRRWLPCVVVLLLCAAVRAEAATITVNDTGDNTTNGDGKCTLREAVANAATNSDTTGGDCTTGTGSGDLIHFAITGAGLHTIAISASFNSTGLNLTAPMTIDGTTQGDSACGDLWHSGAPIAPVLRIKLDGSASSRVGFAVKASNVTIQGLWIDGFTSAAAIGLGDDNGPVTGVTVRCNRLSGSFKGVQQNGVVALQLGGPNPGDGNVIVGSTTDEGAQAGGAGCSGDWEGNFVGIDTDGVTCNGNPGSAGLRVEGCTGLVIKHNLVSCNGTNPVGAQISTGNSADISGIVITQNRAGTTRDGLTQATGASIGDGIQLSQCAGCTVGGAADADGNLASGNAEYGVNIASDSTSTTVTHNIAGPNISDSPTLCNGVQDIHDAGSGSTVANNQVCPATPTATATETPAPPPPVCCIVDGTQVDLGGGSFAFTCVDPNLIGAFTSLADCQTALQNAIGLDPSHVTAFVSGNNCVPNGSPPDGDVTSGVASGVCAPSGPTSTATGTVTRTATPAPTNTGGTPTATPLPSRAPLPGGVTASQTLFDTTTTTTPIIVDVGGAKTATLQLTALAGTCTSYTLQVDQTSAGAPPVTWSPLVTYHASDVGQGVSKIFPVTPLPVGWLRFTVSALSACHLQGGLTLRP